MKNSKKFLSALIFLLAFMFAGKAHAANYYVSTSGNDSNPGTESQPWRTIQKAANTLNGGDTVLVRGGTYSAPLDLSRSGSNGNQITFRRYPGENPAIDAGGGTVGAIVSISGSYITLDGFDIRNSGKGHGIQISGTHLNIWNNKIHDIYTNPAGDDGTHGTYGSGIFVNGLSPTTQSFTTIKYNEIYNVFNSAIALYDAHGGYFLIEGNKVHDWKGEGNWDGILARGTPYVINKNNIIYNDQASNADYMDAGSEGAGGVIEDYTNHMVYDGNNIYCGTCTQPENSYIKMDKKPHDVIIRRNTSDRIGIDFYIPPFLRVGVYHNTITNAGNQAILFWRQFQTEAEWGGMSVKNNIFAFSGGALMQHSPLPKDGSFTNIKMDHNLYRPSSGFAFWAMSPGGEVEYSNTLQDFNRWRTNTGQEPDGGKWSSQSLTQLFSNLSINNYNLAPGSDAIDAGAPLTTTRSAGSGNSVPVVDSFYFYDGYGMTDGDTIQVGQNVVKVIDVDETNRTLIVDRSISWNAGTWVSLPYSGNAPDAGAIESGLSAPVPTPTPPTPSPTPTPAGVKGDINRDGIVNSLDWSLMNIRWFTNDTSADLNGDGIINSLDFSILNNNWLKTS